MKPKRQRADPEVILFIRCKKSLRKRFKIFVDEHEFPNYRVALEKLMDLAETHPELVDVIWG